MPTPPSSEPDTDPQSAPQSSQVGDDATDDSDPHTHGTALVPVPGGDPAEVAEASPTESVTSPGKVMRIGSMVRQLLEEVRQAPLDEASRERLAEVYERSIVELSEALSPDLQQELRLLALPFDVDAVPTDAELRVAQAQLVGWLEGLFHGIQATLFAQQSAAQAQLHSMRQPATVTDSDGNPAPPGAGTYL